VTSSGGVEGEPVEVVIRPEGDGDRAAVRAVHAQAFGDAERVPALVDALRARTAPLEAISLVAVAGERVVGHVMLTACWLDALPRLVDIMTLSPLGVLPAYQGRRIGTRLVERGLAEAERRGVPLVSLEGSPHYYGRRGFTDAVELGFRPPTLRYPPGAYQVARLSAYEAWMTGTIVYSEPFWAHDCVGLRGEALG
jgi:putative acetyltransferase